jgi:hypothetical protein
MRACRQTKSAKACFDELHESKHNKCQTIFDGINDLRREEPQKNRLSEQLIIILS